MTDEQLLAIVEEFLTRTGMAPTRFGIEAMREGGLVKSLRDGRSLSLKNANRVLSFIADWQPDSPAEAEPSATKAGENICAPVISPVEAAEEAAGSAPFSDRSAAHAGSLPTCSTTPEPELPLAVSPSSSSSRSKAA